MTLNKWLIIAGIAILLFAGQWFARKVLVDLIPEMPEARARMWMRIIPLDTETFETNTLLIALAAHGRDDLVRWALEKEMIDGKLLQQRDKVGRTVLHVSRLNVGLEEQLIRLGADVNAADLTGRQPIHYLALRRCDIGEAEQRLDLFVQHGADVNARDKRGNTPLHLACKYIPNPELARLLLEHGADVGLQNNLGTSPLQMAAENGEPGSAEMIQLLEEFEAVAEHVSQLPEASR